LLLVSIADNYFTVIIVLNTFYVELGPRDEDSDFKELSVDNHSAPISRGTLAFAPLS